jgi:hypothetical protein
MTQTIKSCNEIPVGKTYPVEHLRTAESIEQLCEYVDAGHPIATYKGKKIRLLRSMGNAINYSYDQEEEKCWSDSFCLSFDLLRIVKLAPLAYRNGRPLHVGDEIKVLRDNFGKTVPKYEPCKACCAHATTFNRGECAQEWRFADEVEAV